MIFPYSLRATDVQAATAKAGRMRGRAKVGVSEPAKVKGLQGKVPGITWG